MLTGRRVVTLAINVPGPVAAARLRELGARVTKVEPPDGDPLALAAPEWYRELAGGDVVRLDLKASDGRARLDELLAGSDLLLTAQRPSALARLGLAWPQLHERFPRLAQVAIVGERSSERPGHDLTYLAKRGLVEPPKLPRTLAADLLGAERAVTASVAVLSSPEPTYVEVALADAAELLAQPLRRGLTAAEGILGGGFPGYGLYEASDGWIAVAALEPRFRQRLATELGLDELTRDGLASAFRTKTAAAWVDWAAERDLPLERAW
jgi:crotonobetainyl-CoA:carnitine CoA-transferase CaiB-like acyl-CoA transferase